MLRNRAHRQFAAGHALTVIERDHESPEAAKRLKALVIVAFLAWHHRRPAFAVIGAHAQVERTA
jgi:hypothetical protein